MIFFKKSLNFPDPTNILSIPNFIFISLLQDFCRFLRRYYLKNRCSRLFLVGLIFKAIVSIPGSFKHQETETERSEIQGRDMGGELSQPGGAPDGKPHSTSKELCQSPGQLAPHQEVLFAQVLERGNHALPLPA